MNKLSDISKHYETEYQQYFDTNPKTRANKILSIIRWLLLCLMLIPFLAVAIVKNEWFDLFWVFSGFIFIAYFSQYLVDFPFLESMQDPFAAINSVAEEVESIQNKINSQKFSDEQKKDKVFQLELISIDLDSMYERSTSFLKIINYAFIASFLMVFKSFFFALSHLLFPENPFFCFFPMMSFCTVLTLASFALGAN